MTNSGKKTYVSDKKEFILLKMCFNKDLYEAVYEENVERVLQIIEEDYAFETENKFYVDCELTVETLTQIKAQYEEEMKSDDLSWAL